MYWDIDQKLKKLLKEKLDKKQEFESKNLLLSDSSKHYVYDLENSISSSNGEVEYLLGLIYLKDEFTEKDINKAIYYFKEAYNKKIVNAYAALTIIYYYGYYVDKNEETGLEYLKQYFENENFDHFSFANEEDIFDLLKTASGLNEFDATKAVAEFYIAIAEDYDYVPELWSKGYDVYFYGWVVEWLCKLSNLGDKTSAYRAYEVLDEKFPMPDEEFLYHLIKKAALTDKYPPAIKKYNELKDLGYLDEWIEYEKKYGPFGDIFY